MSRYTDPNEDQNEGGSIYDQLPPPEGEQDPGQYESAYNSPEETQPTGEADWFSQAPEAVGAAPFSTTPEGAPERSTQPMAKSDIPTVGESPSEASQKSPDINNPGWGTAATTGASRGIGQGGDGLPSRSPKWDEIARLDKKIEKQNNPGFWGGLGRGALAMQSPGAYNALVGGQGAALQKQRADLVQEAQYDDNRRGLQPQGKAYQVQGAYGAWKWVQPLRGGGLQDIGPAPEPAAVTRAKGLAAYGQSRSQALLPKNWTYAKDPTTGKRVPYWMNPDTHALEPVPMGVNAASAQGNILDADNPTAESPYTPPQRYQTPEFAQETSGSAHKPEYITDDAGNVTEITPGGAPRKLGRLGKSKDVTPREAPEERAGQAAMQEFLRDGPQKGGPQTVQEAYAQGVAAAGGGKKVLPGDFSQQYPKGTTRTKVLADGTKQPMISDGKKWVPATKLRARLASSHGE